MLAWNSDSTCPATSGQFTDGLHLADPYLACCTYRDTLAQHVAARGCGLSFCQSPEGAHPCLQATSHVRQKSSKWLCTKEQWHLSQRLFSRELQSSKAVLLVAQVARRTLGTADVLAEAPLSRALSLLTASTSQPAVAAGTIKRSRVWKWRQSLPQEVQPGRSSRAKSCTQTTCSVPARGLTLP